MINTDHIVCRRYALGMTQKDVADAIGLGVDQVCRIETGKAKPSLRTLVSLCQTLKTEPNRIVRWYD